MKNYRMWAERTVARLSRRMMCAGSLGLAMSGVASAGDLTGDGYGVVNAHEQIAADAYGNGSSGNLVGVGFCKEDTCAPAGCGTENCCETPCEGLNCDDLGCTDTGCTGLCGTGLFGCGGDPFTLSSVLLPEDAPFTIGGWTAIGYTSNSTGLFNSHPDRLNLTQQYLYAERVADGSDGFDLGFRVDGIYGVDAQDTQAFGEPAPQTHFDTDWDNGIYGFAIPQLYAEAAYGDLSVKVGHFYTLVGYEVVTAPDNFFYSHSFTMYNSEPFTHTGALATYNASDSTTVYGGYVFGWDTGFDRFTTGNPGDTSRGSAGIFGVSQAINDNLTVTYIGLAGDMGLNGSGYNHSVVADFKLTDQLNYVFQTDTVNLQQLGSIGVNNFLFYTINDKLAVGGGAEWYKSNLTGNVGQGWESVYVTRAGLNIRPVNNLVIRPEYRYQWGSERIINNLTGTNGDPGVANAGIFGIDAILTY